MQAFRMLHLTDKQLVKLAQDICSLMRLRGSWTNFELHT